MIDPLSARYAIVARGANALTYGASTLGGAIDFISPTARNSAPLTRSSTAAATARSTAASPPAAGARLDGLVTVEGRHWDGYRDHSGQERVGLYGNGGWQPSPTTSVRLFGTYVDNDLRLPGALTRAEVDADPDQASAAALDGDYGKVVTTARLAGKAELGAGRERLAVGRPLLREAVALSPDRRQDPRGLRRAGADAPVEVFSLIVDTDHRDVGAMVRYDRNLGRHDLLLGLNYGDGTVSGGNYRNRNGQPNGLSEMVDNDADSVELFFVDRWRGTDRLTAVFGAQVVSAGRNVRTTNATTGALGNPTDRYAAINPRATRRRTSVG